MKALISRRSQEMSVCGRICWGNNCMYILSIAPASAMGSFKTITPLRKAILPKMIPAVLAQARLPASSAGSFLSIRISRSSTVIRSDFARSLFKSLRYVLVVLYFFRAVESARARIFSSASQARSPAPIIHTSCPRLTAVMARRSVVKPTFSVSISLIKNPIRMSYIPFTRSCRVIPRRTVSSFAVASGLSRYLGFSGGAESTLRHCNSRIMCR